MIKPLADRVIVKEIKVTEEKTSSGIILSSENKQSRHTEGEVIAVGRGRLGEPRDAGDGSGVSLTSWPFYPMECKVGDRVVFSFGPEFEIDGQKVFILKESDILAIIEK
jgi:chaperonin GroES